MVLALLLVSCARPHTLPPELTGTYTSAPPPAKKLVDTNVPPDLALPDIDLGAAFGGADELTVAATGITVKTNDVLKPPQLHVGPLSTGDTKANLFTSVECTSPTTCTFKTKSGCEGSLDKDAKGTLKLIATGGCAVWGGTWTPRDAR